ncbi:MAG: hypothetical protein HEP71_28670 [Roseivirga sp.]|nr:hypothetical protein [Roseivirga sp.]
MKFKLANIEVRIARANAKKKEGKITTKELSSIYDDHLEHVMALTVDEIHQRLSKVTVPDLNSVENLEKAATLLKNEGIFVVPDFLDTETVNKIQNANSNLFSKVNEFSREKGFYEDDSLAVQSTDGRLKTYSDFVDYGKPVACVRQDEDKGMVDVFNYDKLSEIAALDLKGIAEHEGLMSIISKRDTPLSLSNINLYFNKGTKSRGGFHYDDYGNNLKAFIYTLDATDLSFGPYCYVKGTHMDGPYRKLNKLISDNYKLNDTEAPLVPTKSIIPILAKSGSMVVTDQSGIHRGLPQEENAERALMVIRYR